MMPRRTRKGQSSRSGSKSTQPSLSISVFLSLLLKKMGIQVDFTSDLDAISYCEAVTPEQFSDFGRYYLIKEIVSKYSDGSTSAETYAEAKTRFFAAEALCKDTNSNFWSGRVRQSPHWHLILDAREQLHGLLGDAPCLEEASKHFDFGPGATTRLPRRRADRAYKYSGKPETTVGNLVFAHAAVCSVPLWETEAGVTRNSLHDGFTVVSGNKVITVPKSRKTDRAIAIEPDMNIYVQKGFGAVIRRKLRRWGCDLNDQEPNRRLAAEGSRTGRYATIDLSMASDTVSRALVECLLPPKWVLCLEQARSPYGIFEDISVLYEKFSSMGNGFTFELETAIFCSLARACYRFLNIEGHPVVYGDDIIVDTRAFGLVCGLLETCGFRVNPKKSFGSGAFRESCGMHSWEGRDVSPFYIRRPIKGLEEILLLHNNLWRWMVKHEVDRSELCEELLVLLRSLAPTWIREQTVPDGQGDYYFVGASIRGCRRHPYQWDGFLAWSWVPTSKDLDFEGLGLLIKSLARLERSEKRAPSPGSGFPSTPCGYNKKKLVVHCSLNA